MDSKEAVEFINSLFDEKTKPILNELEESICLGVWEGKTYADISAKTVYAEQYLREAGTKLYKRIKEDLGINVNKKNFKNPIEYRYKQRVLEQDFQPLLNTDNLRLTSPPAPLLRGEGSNFNPFVPLSTRVDDPQQFFNRDREIRRVFEVLNSGSSVALIGEEGIGKSSLLWKICQLAESRLQSPRQSVFLDLNWVNDENDFYSALCHEVGIPETRSMLNRNLRSHRVLLAIDNVGKMTWEGFTRQVRSHLRGLAEGSNAPLKLVLAANEPLGKLFNNSQDESKTSPFTGIFQEENLKPWDETTARAFIDARLAMTSVTFTEEEIIQLVQESGGHPRRLMQLCYRTYSRYVEGGE
ncbi:ATP-binding protein [Microcoleus sp. ZQ-A2]|nr:ATP-binding protein [Microcoleus sp. FACHB-1]